MQKKEVCVNPTTMTRVLRHMLESHGLEVYASVNVQRFRFTEIKVGTKLIGVRVDGDSAAFMVNMDGANMGFLIQGTAMVSSLNKYLTKAVKQLGKPKCGDMRKIPGDIKFEGGVSDPELFKIYEKLADDAFTATTESAAV